MAELIKAFRLNGSAYLKENYQQRKILLCNSSEIGGKFLTFLPKLVLEAKASICSTIKKNLLLSYRKFLAFVVVVIT